MGFPPDSKSRLIFGDLFVSIGEQHFHFKHTARRLMSRHSAGMK